MVSCIVRTVVIVGTIVFGGGCRMGVPIHVWQPPTLSSTVGKRVVLQGVAGPQETSKLIKEKLLSMAPNDQGRATTIVSSESLQEKSMVRLASATENDFSDVALASVAKEYDIDYMLRGEILAHNLEPDNASKLNQNGGLNNQSNSSEDKNSRLILSWRLTSMNGQSPPQGQPVVVNLESAVDRYPDLAVMKNPKEVLIIAATRDTYRLITPAIDRQRVQLAIPYGTFGSGAVRRGNRAALSGNWADAEKIWEGVMEKHRMQAAAIHNLALAAAAGQDFSRAKELARQAVRLQPLPLHKKTLVWIELRQRDYHKSFGLPAPPEGWFLTR